MLIVRLINCELLDLLYAGYLSRSYDFKFFSIEVFMLLEHKRGLTESHLLANLIMDKCIA